MGSLPTNLRGIGGVVTTDGRAVPQRQVGVILAASPGEPVPYFWPGVLVFSLLVLSGIVVTRVLRWRTPRGGATSGRLLGVLCVGLSWLLVRPETRWIGVAALGIAASGYWWLFGREAPSRPTSAGRPGSTSTDRTRRRKRQRERAARRANR